MGFTESGQSEIEFNSHEETKYETAKTEIRYDPTQLTAIWDNINARYDSAGPNHARAEICTVCHELTQFNSGHNGHCEEDRGQLEEFTLDYFINNHKNLKNYFKKEFSSVAD